MCGFAGLVDREGGPVDRGAVARMTATLAPRGPDGEGQHFGPGIGLGHRRLAVLDLGPGGAQPMAGAAGQVHLVFNGEIYNFAELRRELAAGGHHFAGRSDTEVLLAGYLAWGEGVLARLVGMYAFAIWDARTRRLFAARDPLGKKPLYFAELPRAGAPPLFAFASELKGLLAAPGFSRSLDHAALAQYLTYEYVPAPRTIFAQASKLGAGEALVVDGAGVHVRRHWQPRFPAQHAQVDEAEATAELERLVEAAVRRRLVADVPLGIFLSGGVDSAAVAAFAAEALGPGRVRTFAMGFSDPSFDESAHARRVAHHLGTDHHEERIEPRTLLEALPAVTAFSDEPLGDASLLPTYLLARSTRQHVTVALGGDGGDELFAGYPTFAADAPARLYFGAVPAPVRALVARAAEMLPARTDYFSLDFKLHQFLRGGAVGGPRRHQRWLASFLPEELPALLCAPVDQDPLALIDVAQTIDPRDQLMDFYLRFYLGQDVNVKVDRAAGAVGLEVRAPLEDVALVDFACQLPPGLRRRRGQGKYLFKRMLRGRLPAFTLARAKQGFALPVARWLKQDLRPALLDELAPARLRADGLFQPAAIARLLDEHLTGRRDRRKMLWTLFVFQRWLRVWGRA